MVLFSFPTSGNISLPFMVVTVLFLLVYYFGWARRSFKGPQPMGDAAELTEIEREFEQAAGEVGTRLTASAAKRGPAGTPAGPPAIHRAEECR